MKAFKLGYLTLLLLMVNCNTVSEIALTALKCEYRDNPLGVDNTTPRFSWKMVKNNFARGEKQTAYQIMVSRDFNDKDAVVWDSGKVTKDQSVNVRYGGDELASGKKYFWKVKIWDAKGQASHWSEVAHFSMGLLQATDWKGDWIHKKDQKKTDHNWYRKTFELSEKAKSAFVYVGSFGYHELYVNGKKVTQNVMNPVSSYMKKRIPYLTYDIADLLQEGKNVIAVWHAAGWARWDRITEYRNPPFVFKVRAEIETASQQISLGTDESWKCKKSHSAYYGDWDILDFGGETIDDRKKEDDWNTLAYDDSDWMNASIYNHETLNASLDEINEDVEVLEDILIGKGKFKNRRFTPITAQLSSQMVEPQVRFKEVTPIGVTKNDDGTYRIDMGENYTGFFEMALHSGKEGDSILFEISDREEVTANWKQKSKYIYGASGEGKFENRFNVAGGRWVTVYGLDYEPELKDIKGYVVTNNRKQISSFESSDPQLNEIYQVNLDTYIANTMDGILVDCPHRERRGWGEVTVAAMYGDALPNFESGAYMDQYLQYTRDAQLPDGQIRAIINENDRPFLMWKANNPLTVWETYKMLGDKKVLQDNYESMQKWMSWMYEHSDYANQGPLIAGERGAREFPGLGDWCTPRGNFWTSSNSPNALHFNNSIYAYMLDNAVKIASALGKEEDVATYSDRLKVQRNATHQMSYDSETGKYVNGQQVNQAFALLAGVTPEAEKKKVYDNLVDNILYKYPYYDTGSSGQALYTRYFLESGERMDLIYELLKDKHHPSYGYFLEQGKTVWPERWSAVGVSQIHTCYTGIGGYFIKGFGGIRPDLKQPGMKKLMIKPAVVRDLEFANTAYESMYGNVVVNWKKIGKGATFHIEVPMNTTAKIYLPATSKEVVSENGVPAENAEGLQFAGMEANDAVGNYVIFDAVSGSYDFEVEQLPKTSFPPPLGNTENLAQLGRISASSMYIETEKLPGFEAFKANDSDDETRWLAAEAENQYLEVTWITLQTFSTVEVDEVGNAITDFKIQIWNQGTWQDVAITSASAATKKHKFEMVKANKCRILIEKATAPPSISEIRIF
jgi:alpha-L-rhamnosidase